MMNGQTLRRSRRWAITAVTTVLLIGAIPLVWRGHDDAFATAGSWTGGVLGGLGFIVAALAIWLTAYLASPQKEETNRLEVARARATEALELVAITTQFAMSAVEEKSEDDPATIWTIRQSAAHSLQVLETATKEGLYRLAAHLDGPGTDPFDQSAPTAGRDSVVLQLMVVQGRLAAIVNGEMALAGADLRKLRNMSVRLYRAFGDAADQVSLAATGAHVPISKSVLALVSD